MSEKQTSTPEKKYYSEQEALNFSKQALKRLGTDILDKALLDDITFNDRKPDHSSHVFIEALKNPTISNVRAAQTILAKASKKDVDGIKIDVDGILGRNTLRAMTFLAQFGTEAIKEIKLSRSTSEGSATTAGERDDNTPIFVKSAIAPQVSGVAAETKLSNKVIQSSANVSSWDNQGMSSFRFTDDIYNSARAMLAGNVDAKAVAQPVPVPKEVKKVNDKQRKAVPLLNNVFSETND